MLKKTLSVLLNGHKYLLCSPKKFLRSKGKKSKRSSNKSPV